MELYHAIEQALCMGWFDIGRSFGTWWLAECEGIRVRACQDWEREDMKPWIFEEDREAVGNFQVQVVG